ncbi:unnamed protein product, partial [marine sediment metagenome]
VPQREVRKMEGGMIIEKQLSDFISKYYFTNFIRIFVNIFDHF